MNFIEVEDVRKKGAEVVAADALKMLDHCDLIYVSFDVDSIDSRFSSGTGTPVPNGLNPDEVRDLNRALVGDPRVCAWEIAEINPTLDSENKMSETAFEVIRSVAEIVSSRPS
jgi:arginase